VIELTTRRDATRHRCDAIERAEGAYLGVMMGVMSGWRMASTSSQKWAVSRSESAVVST